MNDIDFIITEIPISEKGSYSVSRYLDKNYSYNPKYVIKASEGIQWEPEEHTKGGIITFSTDVNSKEQSENTFINWIKQKASTIKNRVLKNKKIDKIAQNHDLVGWTVGKYLRGRYTGKNGKVYDENSVSLEIIGVDSDILLDIAEELCIDFIQESVLVKDYNTGKIFFVDAT